MKRKTVYATLTIFVTAILLAACGKHDAQAGLITEVSSEQQAGSETQETAEHQQKPELQIGTENQEKPELPINADGGINEAGQAVWEDETLQIPLQVTDDNYRTYYEVFVYSFYDSDKDGIGDLQGLISQLDYINDGNDSTHDDLGCNGIWLMPVNPSPTYHKYDVVNYYDIDPQYGTMDDFKELLAECDRRGIKVIMDLVLNHSSSQNAWFKEAYQYLQFIGDKEPDVKECPYIDYYHFTKEAGSGYSRVEGTDWYYEANFWSEMPDLNLDNESLRTEISNITKYWLDMGVGGFRLDAIKEYYTGAPKTNVAFLSWLNETVKSQKEDAYLVGEAWLPMNEYAAYYESGIDSVFDFAFADKDGIISKVLNGANASKYGETIAGLDELFGTVNADYIDAPFYTNHDMGRSAGYYAGDDSVAQTKMAGAMNLFMSGSAFVYYGEELGMKGSGKDENKRAPMYWSKNVNAEGMCDGPKDMDNVKMKFDSLEEQQGDPNSVYQYYKKAIRVRNQNPEIVRGTAEYIEECSNEHVCVLKKTYENAELLLVFVTGAETAEVNLGNILLNGNTVGNDTEIRASMLTGDAPIVLENGVAKMPGFSILILR